jgi:hypothetical protein
MASMVANPHSSDAGMRLQTLKPKFHHRRAAVFILALVLLGFFSLTKHGVYRAYYGGFAGLGAAALIVQYRREHAIVHNRLSAVGVVTDYRLPLRSRSSVLNFIVSKFSPDVPVFKYSFAAFDQRTYTGETGWGSRGLYKGAQITVLYNPGNPAVNHPLTSFIFYSLR